MQLPRRERAARLGSCLRIGLAVALGCGYLGRALSTRTFFGARDALRLYLPLKAFLAQELRHGRLPTWFPYDGAGTSFVGSSVAGLLHPLNALALVLSPAQALKWQLLLAWALGFWAMVGWARAIGARRAGPLFAAAAYATCGYLTSLTDNAPYLLSAAALPLVGGAAESLARAPRRRNAAALGIALALCAWGGDVEAAVLQGLLVVAILASRGRAEWPRRWAMAAVAVSVSLALCSPSIPAIWSAARSSERWGGLGLSEILDGALHPLRFFELIYGAPYSLQQLDQDSALRALLDGGTMGGFWSASEFLGTLAVALAAVGLALRGHRRARTLYATVALLGLWLALGGHAGLYPLFARLPVARAFRYPEKLMPFALAALSLLAGLGVNGLGRSRRAGAVLVVGLAISLVALAVAASPRGLSAALGADVTALASARVVVGMALLGAVALAHFRRMRGAGALATILGLGQAFLCARPALRLEDVARVQRPPAVLDALPANPGRICWDAPHPDRDSIAWGAPDVLALWDVGSTSVYMPGQAQGLTELCGREPLCGSRCARMLGARYGVMSIEAFERQPPGVLKLRGRFPALDMAVVEDDRARPEVALLLVHRVADVAAAMRAVLAGYDVSRAALLVGPGPDLSGGGEVHGGWVTPARWQGEITNGAAAMAIFAQQCSAGWSATVDGESAKLERADFAFCAVPLSAGKHRVELAYLPPGWPWIWLIYALGWAGLAALCLAPDGHSSAFRR